MTTFKLGYTSPLTDTFGAHPILGGPLDLNDGVNYTLLSPDGVKLAGVTRTVVSAGNIRSQGERGVRGVYRHPREIGVSLILGPASTYASFVASIRNLLAWINASPNLPLAIQYQPFSASTPVYLDVIAAAHSIPDDEDQWLRLQLEPVELVFLCRPGLRGDRVTLSNLVMNPGFDAPIGGALAPAVMAFSDTFATLDAYAGLTGSGATLAGNVMTVQANSSVIFGSPAWGAIQTWQLRFQFVTNLVGNFYLHYTDANNSLFAEVTSTLLALYQRVGGVNHLLGSGAIALTNGTTYWITLTQFPSVAGDPPALQARFYTDSGGNIGALALTVNAPCYDAVTALTGRCVIEAGVAAMPVGGVTHTNPVHYLALFGPGAWSYNGNLAAGFASGAWDQNTANTYPNGPVTSQGAARVDLPPAGAVNAQWLSGNTAGTSFITQTASPTAPGNGMAISAYVKSAGIANTCTQEILVNEYDANGNFLRQGTVAGASVTGAQAAWTQLSGLYAPGATCSYLLLLLVVLDNTANSANGTVWWDNVQVYNQTTTGQSSMPYCELRFPCAPAQLVVSGLLGDLPAPAWLAFGTYLASFAAGGAISFAIGRAGQTNKNAALVGNSHAWYTTALSPQSVPVLDGTSYGGWYDQTTVTSGGWNPRAFSLRPSDAPGVYHVFGRFQTNQGLANLANVQVRAIAQQRLEAWYGELTGTDQIGAYYGPYTAPIAASNTWTVCDAGQVSVPPFNGGAALRSQPNVRDSPAAVD